MQQFLAAGKNLVRVALMAGVENDLVARCLEGIVGGNRQLHHAEAGTEMPPHGADHVNHELADFGADLPEQTLFKAAQIVRRVDVFQEGVFVQVDRFAVDANDPVRGSAHAVLLKLFTEVQVSRRASGPSGSEILQ